MAFLDATVYDLTTPQGQSDALSDILDEMNSRVQDSELLNYMNIAAYGELVNVFPDNFGGTITSSFHHGLGFLPASLVFWKDSDYDGLGNDAYELATTFFHSGFAPPIDILSYKTRVDKQNLYVDVDYNTVGSFGFTNNFFFYIFNLPMPT